MNELRELTDADLDLVSGGACNTNVIISKTDIYLDKGVLSIGYIIGCDGIAIPNTTWTPN